MLFFPPTYLALALLVSDALDAAIVRSTIDLARNLGVTVVAEGVEDEQTLQALARLGCHVAQGYHLSRPLPAAELEPWLRGQQSAARAFTASSAH